MEVAVREDFILKAVAFLKSPKVVASPVFNKIVFLKKQGLTAKEMAIASKRAGLQLPPGLAKFSTQGSSDDKEAKGAVEGDSEALHTALTQSAARAGGSWTLQELRQFDGKSRREIYISLRGIVYDCTGAPQFYGPGRKYNVYAGREAGRALGKMTLMDFPQQHEDDLTNPWVEDMSSDESAVLLDWIRKFSKKYPVVGVVKR